MTIGLQGAWTISVRSRSASWGQRFTITGTTNSADGTYDGVTSTAPVLCTGPQWGVTVEHDPSGPTSWRPSRMRLADFRTSGGVFQVDLESDDGGGADEDFNDLVLTATMPLSASDWVVHGQVRTYSGNCVVNPCFPRPWVVVETPEALQRVLGYAEVRHVVERLYPDRVGAAKAGSHFRPLLLPTGVPDTEGFSVRGATELALPDGKGRRKKSDSASAIETTAAASLHAHRASHSLRDLTAADLSVIGRLGDVLRRRCDVSDLALTLLRFVEYDRTADELAGGAYTGDGVREVLGTTATDEFGSYVFRFSRSVADIVEESSDLPASGNPAVEANPDLIIQIPSLLPDAVAWETAPYYNIPNVRRIDLCIPESQLDPRGPACQGGHVIQTLGNIAVIPNPHSRLFADGTVTNPTSTPAGPTVERAAWHGSVDVFGCFTDTEPAVTHYTVEFRRAGEGWNHVSQLYEYWKQQSDGTWDKARVGPDARSLAVNGASNPPVLVPSYENIEDDPSWLLAQRTRKITLATSAYQPTSGQVEFRIRGFDASGDPVPGVQDTVNLFIDNTPATGSVDWLRLPGGTDPGECALFELDADPTDLEIRFRVEHANGFLASYGLSVVRGSNTAVGYSASPAVTSDSYPAPAGRWYGTPNQPTSDLAGFVEATLTPTPSWLGGRTFCAFSFALGATVRKTNGYSGYQSSTLWQELIGMSHEAPPD